MPSLKSLLEQSHPPGLLWFRLTSLSFTFPPVELLIGKTRHEGTAEKNLLVNDNNIRLHSVDSRTCDADIIVIVS